jgi:hypothetical protein
MAIAAMANRSVLVALGKLGGLDSPVASFRLLGAMRRILAADLIRASRALQDAPRPTIGRVEQQRGEQFRLPPSSPNAESSRSNLETNLES